MRALQIIRRQHSNAFPLDRYASDLAETRPRNGEMPIGREFRMHGPPALNKDNVRGPCGTGGFFQDFSADAQRDFTSLATHFRCPGSTVLISEAQEPSRVLFLLEGEVNISMNSSDGKRLLLEVAGAGDTLGLTSALSGDSSEIRAQSMYPCRIASLQRRDFLGFISRHPVAGQNVARELCVDLARARERLRILGLTSTATARLALLLLEWCREGQRTAEGIQIRFVLTHREIGECIGASRETVSRTLTDFRVHDLVKMRGSILVVTSCHNLANYAGIDTTPDPQEPAA